MSHHRFVALISSVLLIASMVLCMAVPAFASSEISKTVEYDGYSFTFPEDAVSFLAYYDSDSSSFIFYWSVTQAESIYFQTSDADGDLYLYFSGCSLYQQSYIYPQTKLTSVTSYGNGSVKVNSGSKVIVSASDLVYENGEVIFDPFVPPLVAATEGANLMAVMNQVLAILPIGLVCLVGYLGLRKALAFCRRILSGA